MLEKLDRRVVTHRVIDGIREAGVLFATFAPLDAAFTGREGSMSTAVLLFALGGLCFCSAIFVEARYVGRT
jgi:hypothetical protein